MSEPTFSLQEAMAAQSALRHALDLPPEEFKLNALVGMMSDEIEQLRAVGKTDRDIATLLTAATGKSITPESVTQFYAPPDQRKREK
jgi:hypothetical protein